MGRPGSISRPFYCRDEDLLPGEGEAVRGKLHSWNDRVSSWRSEYSKAVPLDTIENVVCVCPSAEHRRTREGLYKALTRRTFLRRGRNCPGRFLSPRSPRPERQ